MMKGATLLCFAGAFLFVSRTGAVPLITSERTFAPCAKNNTDVNGCLERLMQTFLYRLRDGLTEPNLPKVNSVKIDELSRSANDKSLPFDFKLTDVTLSKFSRSWIMPNRSVNFDLDKETANLGWTYIFTKIIVEADINVAINAPELTVKYGGKLSWSYDHPHVDFRINAGTTMEGDRKIWSLNSLDIEFVGKHKNVDFKMADGSCAEANDATKLIRKHANDIIDKLEPEMRIALHSKAKKYIQDIFRKVTYDKWIVEAGEKKIEWGTPAPKGCDISLAGTNLVNTILKDATQGNTTINFSGFIIKCGKNSCDSDHPNVDASMESRTTIKYHSQLSELKTLNIGFDAKYEVIMNFTLTDGPLPKKAEDATKLIREHADEIMETLGPKIREVCHFKTVKQI